MSLAGFGALTTWPFFFDQVAERVLVAIDELAGSKSPAD
jgi:hypothetical protein